MEGYIIAAMVLGEGFALSLVGLGLLWWRHRRVCGEVGQLREALSAARQASIDYAGFVDVSIRQTRQRYKKEQGAELLTQDVDEFDMSLPPPAHALRLRHAFLTAETKVVQAYQQEPRQLWSDKLEYAQWLLQCFERAERAFSHWLVRYNEAQTKGQPESAAESRVKELEAKLAQAEERLADVTAYRKRFGDLYGHVVEESDGSRRLRGSLRAHDQPVAPAEVESLLAQYETARQPLESYLGREDVALFDGRDVERARSAASERHNLRSEQLAETAAARVRQSVEQIREVAVAQRSLVGELGAGLGAGEKNALISSYERQIRQLERTIGDAERCIEVLESENERQRRVVRRLLKRLGAGEDRDQQVRVLEEAVDRFSRQAMELTSRLYALEEEKDALENENRALKQTAPATSAS